MQCPICNKAVDEPNPGQKSYYPFCSERCKLIDLGRWLGGKYQIPVRETDRDRSDEVLPHHGVADDGRNDED
jgi:endogenous inhibitor of DNA gyrase (YacG/DUF329 family)